MSDQRLHIEIDVNVAEDEIQGQVCDGARRPREFSGWLGLIGELDGMLGCQRQDVRSNGPSRPKGARDAR